MDLTMMVIGAELEIEKQWVTELTKTLKGTPGVRVLSGSAEPESAGKLLYASAQIILIDQNHPRLDDFLKQLDRRNRALFLIVDDADLLPKQIGEGRVDDVVVVPFRRIEILSKIRYLEQVLMWNEVSKLNAGLSQILKHLRSDLQLAERLHQLKSPKRFPEVTGFQVSHRYLAGLRPGGDHFDLAESTDGSCLSLVYFHSSSYGLAGAILSILMSATLKLSVVSMESAGAPADIVRRVYNEILLTMSPRDQVSLFFGIYNRQEKVLRYVNLGKACVFFAPPATEMAPLSRQGGAITHNNPLLTLKEESIGLDPGSRFVLVSEGFTSGMGGATSTLSVLDRLRSNDARESLNELALKLKSPLMHDSEDTGMPAQDCTAVVLDAALPTVTQVRRRE